MTASDEITIWVSNANQMRSALDNKNPIPQIACRAEMNTMILRRSNLSTIGPASGEKKNDGNTYAAYTSDTRKVESVASLINPTRATYVK